MKVRILCDTCSMEVFVDDGRMAFTNAFFFTNPKSELTLINESSDSLEYSFCNIKKNKER